MSSVVEQSRPLPSWQAILALEAEGRLHEALAATDYPGGTLPAVLANARARILIELERYEDVQNTLRHTIDSLSDCDAAILTKLLHKSEKACLEPWQIQRLIDRLQECSSPSLRSFKERQERRVAFADHRLNIVSLGFNCLPWHLVCRWGLVKPADYASLMTPFALAFHKLEGVLEALETDFQSYVSPDSFSVVESTSGKPFIIRADRSVAWNHNKGRYWTESFERLVQSLEKKAANFRAACRRDNLVFVVGKAEEKRHLSSLPQLNEALSGFTGSVHNRILLTSQSSGDTVFRELDEYTMFFNASFPDAGYVWYEDSAADSPDGLAYERRYIDALMQSLERWGLLPAGK